MWLDEVERPEQDQQAEQADRDPDPYRQRLDGALRLALVLDEKEQAERQTGQYADEDCHYGQLRKHWHCLRERASRQYIAVSCDSPAVAAGASGAHQ